MCLYVCVSKCKKRKIFRGYIYLYMNNKRTFNVKVVFLKIIFRAMLLCDVVSYKKLVSNERNNETKK